jgi:hypothetical protein
MSILGNNLMRAVVPSSYPKAIKPPMNSDIAVGLESLRGEIVCC